MIPYNTVCRFFRRSIGFVFITVLGVTTSDAQEKIALTEAKFSKGDNNAWIDKNFNDASWQNIKANEYWERQGISYDGYAWYRFHMTIPSSLKKQSALKDSLVINLAHIDDCDETYLNGKLIGKTGRFPQDPGGYNTAYYRERRYHVAISQVDIKWDQDNVLAVRVYDGGGDGGINEGTPYLSMLDYIDKVALDKSGDFSFKGQSVEKVLKIRNGNNADVKGTLQVSIKDDITGKVISDQQYPLTVKPHQTQSVSVKADARQGIDLHYVFTESITGKKLIANDLAPYILTPSAPQTPRINGAQVTGARPGSPFLYKIAATGRKPETYTARGLPEGLKLDRSTGIISGSVSRAGDYPVKITVTNALGKAERVLTVKIGNLMGLTPAMGWNSWNCWGLSVTADKVKSSAQALIDKGLIDHGWTYVNIDDGWESPERAADGTIRINEKFGDMKSLGDWLHSKGLKFGIYSSPGRLTCGGYTGSYQHEQQDAESYNKWGIDYLKYDWCSYSEVAGNDTSLETFVKPYAVMEKALRSQPRDIYYSLCQYGMKDVWKWGAKVDANSWRTTGDITDTWQSLYSIGFAQYKIADYAQPGRWNDPDMLIVGKLGWSGTLRNTRLTPDEQYTHISLWSLLSAPLLIGCDISRLDDFTTNLLSNDEVIAVNQDPLGKEAHRIWDKNNFQVYQKELADGNKAIGLFNLENQYRKISVKLSDLQLKPGLHVRDLWRQKDMGTAGDSFTYLVPPHGVILIKVSGR